MFDARRVRSPLFLLALSALAAPSLAQAVAPIAAQRALFAPANPAPLVAGAVTTDVVSGDFNADGVPDLVLTDGPAGSVCFLGGTSVGAGTTPPTYSAPPVASTPFSGLLPGSVAAADLDADGLVDAVTYWRGSNQLVVHVYYGATDFPSRQGTILNLTAAGFAGSKTLAVADFDGDGALDVAALSADSVGPSVQIALNDGTGSGWFCFSAGVGAAGVPVALAAADVDADGDPDLVVAANVCVGGSCSAYVAALVNGLADACLGFLSAAPSTAAVFPATSIVRIEFDGSAGDEIFLLSPTAAEYCVTSGPTIACAPSAVLATSLTFALPAWTGVDAETIALDGPGLESLVLPDGAGGFSILRNTGSFLTTTEGPFPVAAFSNGSTSIGVGDFDGDGEPDVVGAYDGVAAAMPGCGGLRSLTRQAAFAAPRSAGSCTNTSIAIVGNAGFSNTVFNPGSASTTLVYSGGPPFAEVHLLASAGAPSTPYAFVPCAVWIDPSVVGGAPQYSQLAAGYANAAGGFTYVHPTANPNASAGLIGLSFVVQVVAYDPGGPGGDWNWSDGLVVTLGY
jgi:hypothetical protein